MKIKKFEDLDSWQEAVSLAVDIYEITNKGKFGKDFAFGDQLRRASVSIASNIAEGKERETVNEFIRFLYIAKGSAGELKTQLHIAHKIGYLDDAEYLELKQRVEKLSGMIGSLIKTLKKKK